MARLLQHIDPVAASEHASKAWRTARIATITAVVLLTGCILSPPIEPRNEPNLSPRLQPRLPDEKSAVFTFTRETLPDDREVHLAADLFDVNNEPELHYLFLSNERSDLTPLSTGGAVEEAGAEFYFGRVEYTARPCDGNVSIPGSEVITLYVSDRRFQSLSLNTSLIEEAEGAYMVAFSWTLKYEAGICDSFE